MVKCAISSGTPAEPGMPKVATPEPAFDQQAVGVAVIAALELDDVFAAGEAAGEADRRHGGFGAGADEAKLLDRRDSRPDERSARSASAGVDAPKLAECAAACWMASTTGGKAWPRIIGPQEPK